MWIVLQRQELGCMEESLVGTKSRVHFTLRIYSLRGSTMAKDASRVNLCLFLVYDMTNQENTLNFIDSLQVFSTLSLFLSLL